MRKCLDVLQFGVKEMKNLVDKLLHEFFPEKSPKFNDDLDLLIEAVMWYYGIYYKAAFLVDTNKKNVSEEEKEIIFDKDAKLERLNQRLQLYRKSYQSSLKN